MHSVELKKNKKKLCGSGCQCVSMREKGGGGRQEEYLNFHENYKDIMQWISIRIQITS